MANMFQKASKKQSKLRLAIFGASGSGKTYSALSIATGLEGEIAFIDTEKGSASKYADIFNFDVANLENTNIENYLTCMEEAQRNKCKVLVIDSLTHAWQELVEEIDRIAKAKYNNNTWRAWSEGNPKQKKLIKALLNFDGHIIATMRSRTEWMVEKDEKTGKTKPVRIGTVPEQGKGIEYEFDMLMDINAEHYATIIKDRTGKFQDKIIEKPGIELGRDLIKWLNMGEKEQPNIKQKLQAIHEQIEILLKKRYGEDKEKIKKELLTLTKDNIDTIEKLNKIQAEYVLKELLKNK